MKEQDLKLILADIDGTLVEDATRTMLPFTREVLNHLHSKGVMFGIASGRPTDELSAVFKEYGMDFQADFIIGMNGGEVEDYLSHEKTSCYPLTPEDIKFSIEMMKDYTEVNPVIYRNHMLVCRFYDDMIKMSEIHANKTHKIVENDAEYWQSKTGKIMLRTQTPEECLEIEEFAKARIPDHLAAFKTQPTLLEIQNKSVNKGVALHQVAEAHSIPVESIIAFGDASNDNEMLREAGLGVCMINGLPDTKASADVISDYDCDADGMVRYLYDHFRGLFNDFKSEHLDENGEYKPYR
ncbi:MAG: HAD-IIB family hydrolase [Allobaculum sp.]